MARVEEPGRIVLESPQLLLAQLQRRIAAGRAAMAAGDVVVDGDGQGGADRSNESSIPQLSMAEDLLAERAAETAAEELKDVDAPAAEEAADAATAAEIGRQGGRGSRS